MGPPMIFVGSVFEVKFRGEWLDLKVSGEFFPKFQLSVLFWTFRCFCL